MHINQFVLAVAKGAEQLPLGDVPWVIKVLRAQKCIGYAVGQGRNWRTTLSPEMTALPDSKVITVKA